VALVGTHDTPTLAGWLTASDVPERVHYKLLPAEAVPAVRAERARAVGRLCRRLRRSAADPRALLEALLEWLGRSRSPLFVPWLEDLWLEPRRVNLPGTRSSDRPNWQGPMRKLLDEIFADADIDALLRRLDRARKRA
jgi:4-alpha-glucanotransferase